MTVRSETPRGPVPVSVVIPVKNEADNLARCLKSVQWADEIFVVDSQSTDGTADIAQQLGATVVQFRYNGSWPKKKNWALQNLSFRHHWVLLIDADETLPPQAEIEIQQAVTSSPEGVRGYWINRRFLFIGRWLRHAYYPNWNLRLFQHRHGRFEQLTDADTGSGDVEVHEHVIVDGKTARLRSQMDHFAFPTIATFVDKHNRYSSWEAHVACAPARFTVDGPLWLRLRRRIKHGVRALPFRPLLRFLYVYVWQRGFLDGREGYYFARLHTFYEFLSVAKTYELRRTRDRNDTRLPG
jgi:glycosyltransferase involved in cell wall biosynthesis